MWDIFKKAVAAQQVEASHGRAREAAQPVAVEAMTCCAGPMDQRLARARDRLGQLVFVGVWRCARCARVRL
jgi:hypothetical protein